MPITAILSIYWNTLTKMMYQLIYYLIKPLVIMCTNGGYCPAGITFEERTKLLATNSEKIPSASG